MLARAFRRTGQWASAAPAQIEPSAYEAATREKLPAPPPESRSHQLRNADDPGSGRERDRDAEHHDGGRKRRPGTQGGEAITDSRTLGALPGPAGPDSDEQCGGEEERDGVQPKEDADRQERQQHSRERPAAHGERVGRRPHEAVGLLHVASLDERGKQCAVRRLEVAGRGREHECRDDQRDQGQVPGEAGDRDRHEHDSADEIGRDHEPAPIPAVGGDTAVQAEQKRGHAVGKANGDHSERPCSDQREPHQRDVLEGIAELADRHGGVGTAEARAAQQPERALRVGRASREQFFRSGPGVGHARVLPRGAG